MLTEFLKFLQGQNNFGPVDAVNSDPVALPDGIRLTSLETLNLHRYRERYAMRTSSIEAFIEYTNGRNNGELIASVNPGNCTAYAIFNARDKGEPGHCDDTATCELTALPDYVALQRIGESDVGVMSTQRDLIEWIHDWNDSIADAAKLIKSFTKLSVDSVGRRTSTERDFGVEKSALEQIDIKSEGADVPAEIAFTFTPYELFEPRTATLSVSARARDGKIWLRVRVRRYEQIKLEVAQEFVAKLEAGLSAKPIIGTIKPS